MKKTTIAIIGLASTVLLASLILIFTQFLPKIQKDETEVMLKEKLEEMVKDYYDNDFKKLMPNFLESNESLTVTLDYLQGVNKDIEVFEEHNCSYNDTYVNIKFDEEKEYTLETVLNCEY